MSQSRPRVIMTAKSFRSFVSVLSVLFAMLNPLDVWARGDETAPGVAAEAKDIPVSVLQADPAAKDPSEVVPKQFENVTVMEKLNTQLDLSREFIDEEGRKVRLSDFVDGSTPVIFTLNYYSCEMLCSIQIGGFANGLKAMDPAKRKELRIVTVSFDPRDTAAMAKAKKDAYLATLEGEKPQWHFLTGTEANVKALADAFGFQYRYDAETDQYAHTAAIFFVTPRGKISRYLYGIEYSARDLRFAWIEASEGKWGGKAERLLLNCFHYDETTGKYTPFAFRVVRIGGVVTVGIVGFMLGVMWRREKRRLAGGWDRAV